MSLSNLERLVRLADEVFAVKNDPSQLDVDQDVINRLRQIHPYTVSEYNDGNGPVAWVLIIPTTAEIMRMFFEGKITEKDLYELTPVGVSYEAMYLCSALVLEEYRQKGIAKQLTIHAINEIRAVHPINALFVWPFTMEGNLAAERIAALSNLPLYKRKAGK
ncbi:MAG TPA: GNAT family N-acetyltransferase [Bacteroidales bacterium]|nr:GNAT family N-acetyltransferase [Bacteroidales bacterium]